MPRNPSCPSQVASCKPPSKPLAGGEWLFSYLCTKTPSWDDIRHVDAKQQTANICRGVIFGTTTLLPSMFSSMISPSSTNIWGSVRKSSRRGASGVDSNEHLSAFGVLDE